nr:MAG TPA: hypothetical protein [Caudoviricetes sp.]
MKAGVVRKSDDCNGHVGSNPTSRTNSIEYIR